MKTTAKGTRFLHQRVLNPAHMPNKVPMLYEVTTSRQGNVYYRPVFQRIDETGNVYREDFGKSEYCSIETFARIAGAI